MSVYLLPSSVAIDFILCVTIARSSKNEACCSRTLKRCVSEVQGVRRLLSPERPETVLEEEIRALGSEEKH